MRFAKFMVFLIVISLPLTWFWPDLFLSSEPQRLGMLMVAVILIALVDAVNEIKQAVKEG